MLSSTAGSSSGRGCVGHLEVRERIVWFRLGVPSVQTPRLFKGAKAAAKRAVRLLVSAAAEDALVHPFVASLHECGSVYEHEGEDDRDAKKCRGTGDR